jgi:hypothetical protein
VTQPAPLVKKPKHIFQKKTMIKLNSIAKFNNLNPQTNADVSKFIPQKIVIFKNISIKATQEEHSLTNTDCEED